MGAPKREADRLPGPIRRAAAAFVDSGTATAGGPDSVMAASAASGADRGGPVGVVANASKRRFAADTPNRVPVTDITALPLRHAYSDIPIRAVHSPATIGSLLRKLAEIFQA